MENDGGANQNVSFHKVEVTLGLSLGCVISSRGVGFNFLAASSLLSARYSGRLVLTCLPSSLCNPPARRFPD